MLGDGCSALGIFYILLCMMRGRSLANLPRRVYQLHLFRIAGTILSGYCD